MTGVGPALAGGSGVGPALAGGSGVVVAPPFPTVRSSNAAGGSTPGAGVALTLPTGAASGDLVLYFISQDGVASASIGASTGWTTLGGTDLSAFAQGCKIFARVLDGTTGDNILTFTGGAQDYAAIGVCIETGTHPYTTSTNLATAIVESGTGDDNATEADPPNSNTGIAADRLWLAWACFDKTSASDTFTAGPANYDLLENISSANSTSATHAGLAVRSLNASAENPGAFTALMARKWIAYTVPIAPNPNPVLDPLTLTWHLYLEANRMPGETNGGGVDGWPDQSGNGRDAVTSVSSGVSSNGTFVTNVINGQPVVRFNGTNNGMDLPTSARPSSPDAELFILCKVDADPPGAAAQAGHPLQMGGTSGGSATAHFPFTDSSIYETWGTSSRKGWNPTPALTNWVLYNVRVNTGTWQAFIDGTNSSGNTSPGTIQWNQRGPYIGHDNGSTGDRWFDGDLVLIAISDSVLSTVDRENFHTYLETTYGLTIA